MFGLEFLFSAALFAIPLAGVPVLLHLLLRQRTPTVQFSTLRFVKSSLQRTAARRKVKRWLLLSLRVLLLLLLIWAVAQPATKLAGDWFGGAGSGVAAIVVDTSYSMQLRPESTDGGGTLLDRADSAVRELLRGPLSGAQVAVFTSNPAPPDRPEMLTAAPALLTGWASLRPEAAPVPLVDQIASATGFLSAQNAPVKWLLVLTDNQRREFPRTAANLPEGVRVVWLDLHTETVRDAGITRVWLDPQQPIPGVGAEAAVEVTGRAGETRAVSISLVKPDQSVLSTFGPVIATFDGGGRSVVRFPLQLPVEPWVILRATLGGQDAVEWNNTRDLLVRVPRKQRVTVVSDEQNRGAGVEVGASRFVKLALDPSEGAQVGWPLEVKSGAVKGDEDAVFVTWTTWPDAATVDRLTQIARRGGRVVVMLHPALGATWTKLSASQREAIGRLLPGEPLADEVKGTWRMAAPDSAEPLTGGLDAGRLRFGDATFKRLVGFGPGDGQARSLIDVVPANPVVTDSNAPRTVTDTRRRGVLFRRTVGAGEVYTLATLPDARLTNLATHPVFLPLMVRMALPVVTDSATATTLNGEMGGAITLTGADVPANSSELELVAPGAAVTRLRAGVGSAGPVFTSDGASTAGLYAWHRPGEPEAIAYANVSYPSAETEVAYRPTSEIVPAGPDVIVARSYADLTSHLTEVSQPTPRWPAFVAGVLVLVCVESMVGSVSQWKRQTAVRA